MPTIAVDVPSGDGSKGFAPIIEGAVAAVLRDSSLKVKLVGPEIEIKQHLTRLKAAKNKQIEIIQTDQVITQNDGLMAAKNKRKASILLCLDMVKNHVADGVVSSAHTGFLTGFGEKRIGRIDKNFSPFLIALIPTAGGTSILADVGAHIVCSKEELASMTRVAVIYAELVLGMVNPSIGLLNTRSEDGTGGEAVVAADEYLKAQGFANYQGFVEPNTFRTEGRIRICMALNGREGNLVLKATEGDAKENGRIIKEEFTSSEPKKLTIGRLIKWPLELVLKPIIKSQIKGRLERIKRRIYPPELAHAFDLAVNGVVVKVHGGCEDWEAYMHAITSANKAVVNELVKTIRDGLTAHQDTT